MKTRRFNNSNWLVLLSILLLFGCTENKAEEKYEELRKSVPLPYPISPATVETENKLEEVLSSWTVQSKELNGPHSDALTGIGYSNNIQGLRKLFLYEMPNFDSSNPEKMREAAKIGTLLTVIRTKSIDEEYYYFSNPNQIFIRPSENAALLFKDTEEGLLEILFAKEPTPNQTVQETGTVASDE